MNLLQITPPFPEQQHRTGRTHVPSDSGRVCRRERSVTPTAWALCLAQVVTRTMSSRSKLIRAQSNPPPACLRRRVAETLGRGWGAGEAKERNEDKDTNPGLQGARRATAPSVAVTPEAHQAQGQLLPRPLLHDGAAAFQRRGPNGSAEQRGGTPSQCGPPALGHGHRGCSEGTSLDMVLESAREPSRGFWKKPSTVHLES